MIANVMMFLLIAVGGGLGSCWYMIERGSSLTTHKAGPWRAWIAAGQADADPYTRAHFIRRGMLPVSSTLAVTFEALTDSEGQRLHSSCEYTIDGVEPPARFWSLSVFDDQGRLIPNAADRFSYNSATLLKSPGGRLSIALARSARSGNWLPTGGAGRISLVLTIEESTATLVQSGNPDDAGAGTWQPPGIRRVNCR
jgi:hypothetical protein